MTSTSEQVSNTSEQLNNEVSDQIESAKETITAPLPTPPNSASEKAEPKELLDRLNWGEPALTIIDIRDRTAFNSERIMGAIPVEANQFPQAIESLLESNRDIYIYGENADTTYEAANHLRQSGFENVAELNGGLTAWKQAGGPTEGIVAFSSPVTA